MSKSRIYTLALREPVADDPASDPPEVVCASLQDLKDLAPAKEFRVSANTAQSTRVAAPKMDLGHAKPTLSNSRWLDANVVWGKTRSVSGTVRVRDARSPASWRGPRCSGSW